MSYLTNIFRLKSYWWLLIWPFVFGIFLTFIRHERMESVFGKEECRWEPWAAVVMALPLVLWAGFRGDIIDTGSYRTMFSELPAALSEWGAYLEEITKDKGFSVFSLVIKMLIGNRPQLYFLIIAIIQGVCIVPVLRKYSANYWLSIFFFVASTDYISWMYNTIRQFTAVCLIFAATTLILKKKYIPAVLIILLAALFHQSALLMLPMVFILHGKAFNKGALICIIVAVGVLFFADRFTNLLERMMSDTQYVNVVSDWESWNDDGMNPIRVLVYSIPALFALLGIRVIRQENDIVVNFCVNASVITTALGIVAMATSGIFMGRLLIYTSLYSSCILLPWEIENIFTEKSAQMVKLMAILGYVAFFYYQMHFTWGFM